MNSAKEENILLFQNEVLQKQLDVREQEIASLMKEITEKELLIEELAKPHLQREEELLNELKKIELECLELSDQVIAMTETLKEAEQLIEITNKNRIKQITELEKSITTAKHKEQHLLRYIGKSKAIRQRKAIIIGIFAFIIGIAPFIFIISLPFIWQKLNETDNYSEIHDSKTRSSINSKSGF